MSPNFPRPVPAHTPYVSADASSFAVVAVNRCTHCGLPADPEAPAVLASGLNHPLCAHPRWSVALVASAAPFDVDGLAVGLLRARQQVRALKRA
ncbi:hypothetical protein [Microbacterium sp. HMWF026]|uniref:hypothetical protein n=1 Tax=Microbacterium sp. HMWF026 TaxID=2056861 RepID=UPI0011B276CD|nr:hypothetical protein [Microbacterium sp. HMWF026]